MTTDLSPWLVATFSSKILLYIAYAMSVGGVAATFLIQRYKPQHLPYTAYTLWGVILGIVTSSLYFFIQVGAFSESGVQWNVGYHLHWHSLGNRSRSKL